MKKNLTFYFL